VEEILTGFFDGRFEPGQRMRVLHLADLFGMSATPVREALVELEGFGVIELRPNRGGVLRSFGPKQLMEICQMRRILECEAVRCANGHISQPELAEFANELEALIGKDEDEKWVERTLQIDSRLHELIASRCGSERLRHEIARYSMFHRTLRDCRTQRVTGPSHYSQADENREHLAVVRALELGDAFAASSAMAAHINHAAEGLQQDLFSQEQIEAARSPILDTPS